jgi:hypothetical protein
MKITEKKLRQIIREEKMKLEEIRLGAKQGLEGVAFYEQKANLLATAQGHLEEAMSVLADVIDLDLESAMGEDPDVQSAYNDVEEASEFIDGIIQATEAMVTMGRRG